MASGGGTSLRGLSPEQQVAQNQQGMKGLELALNVMAGQQDFGVAQQTADTQRQEVKRKTEADARSAEKVSRSAIRKETGPGGAIRQVRDVFDDQGTWVGTEDLGQVADFTWFESPPDSEGSTQIQPFRDGEAPPPNWRALTQRSLDLSANQEATLRQTMSSVQYLLATGRDPDNKQLTGNQLAIYVDLQNDLVERIGGEMPLWMLVPEEPISLKGSWTKTPAQAVRLPYDEDLKRHLTPADIEKLVQKQGISIREALTLLGVLE